MLPTILDDAARRQLAEARETLAELRDALNRFGATDADLAALTGSIRQLDDFFLLVVVGEFNAGKSAFINALVGERVLDEGVTPTTARIHVIGYGEHGGSTGPASTRITAPVDFLRDVHIVDTPGTNAILREHEQLTTDFVPRSDLVLFVTSADRPFTESERAFLQSIRDWGKKIVIVLNKVDLLEREVDLQEVLTFMREAAGTLLGFVPEIFPVSARFAMKAKQGERDLWGASRFEALERYLVDTLDEAGRFRLKLSNPVGVGHTLAGRYADVADQRLRLLAEDLQLLDDVDRQREMAQTDISRGFELRLSAIERILVEMEQRGAKFFEDTLRLARVVDLLNRARIQREFEEQVVSDAPQQIERQVAELIDWLVDEDFREWQGVTSRLSVRQQAHADRILGAPDVGTFHQDRARLIDEVRREAQRVVETYDKQRESEAIADAARSAVAATVAAGASAVGLGTLVTMAATTAAADITGLAAAGVIATIGLLVLPAKRRRARHELSAKVGGLREQLAATLHEEFTRARTRSASRLDGAMAPYSRFVRAEESRWQDARATLRALGDRLGAMGKT